MRKIQRPSNELQASQTEWARTWQMEGVVEVSSTGKNRKVEHFYKRWESEMCCCSETPDCPCKWINDFLTIACTISKDQNVSCLQLQQQLRKQRISWPLLKEDLNTRAELLPSIIKDPGETASGAFAFIGWGIEYKTRRLVGTAVRRQPELGCSSWSLHYWWYVIALDRMQSRILVVKRSWPDGIISF